MASSSTAGAALASWRAALGDTAVADDAATLSRYARTTTGAGVAPVAVLFPVNTEQVSAAVRVAAEHGVALHPISRGCNWGYTDAAPLTDNAAILDLSRMNRILEINSILGYAVIEPGVTQQQLYEAVRAQAPGFRMDATGAGPEASVLGNALERGFGHTPYGDHVRTACALEAVLADASVVNTGFGRFHNARATDVYPYGVGPMLDGVFSQSNLGIVTHMTVWLWPKPQAFKYFFILLNEDHIGALIDALRPLRLQGVLNGAVHIGNDLRVISAQQQYPWEEAKGVTPLPEDLRTLLRNEAGIGLWNVSGAVTGTRGHVRDAARLLKRAASSVGGRAVFVDDQKLALAQRVAPILGAMGFGKLQRQLKALVPNYGLLQGVPTAEPIRSTQWRLRQRQESLRDPRDTDSGLLWLSPVLPLIGEGASAVLQIISPILHKAGFDVPVTFTMLNERSMVCIVNISYDRAHSGEEAAALAAYGCAQGALMAEGYYPYRTSYHGAQMLPGSTADDLLAKLRLALDPQGTMAPRMPSPPQDHV